MKTLIVLMCLIATPCVAQTTRSNPSKATTSGPCSPAVTGNNNTFTFKCVGLDQQKAIIAKLNQLLAKDDISVVISKLDELLKRTNPNGTVTTYDCAGDSRAYTAAIGKTNSFADLPGVTLRPMLEPLRSGDMDGLLRACLAEIANKPEWLTPRLMCGIAYIEKGDKVNAKAMLDYYDANVGPAYDAPFCKSNSARLRDMLSK